MLYERLLLFKIGLSRLDVFVRIERLEATQSKQRFAVETWHALRRGFYNWQEEQIARELVQFVEILGITFDSGQIKQFDQQIQENFSSFAYLQILDLTSLLATHRFGQIGYDRIQCHCGDFEQTVYTVRCRPALVSLVPCKNFRRQQAKVERYGHLRVKAHRFEELC